MYHNCVLHARNPIKIGYRALKLRDFSLMKGPYRGLEPDGPDFEPLVKGGGCGELGQLVLAVLLYVAVRWCVVPGGGSCGCFVLVILGGRERR